MFLQRPSLHHSRFRRDALRAGALAGVCLACFHLPASAQTAPAPATPAGSHIFRTGFPLYALRNVDASDAKVAAHILIKRIVEQQGLAYTTEIPETEQLFEKNLVAGNYDFFLIFGYDYLRLRNHVPMTPRVVGTATLDEPLDRLVLLATGENIEAAKGGQLLIEAGSGRLPRIWLDTVLLADGRPGLEDFFGEIEDASSISKALLPVFFGKAAACVVTQSGYRTMTELNPQIGRRLNAVALSDQLLLRVMCTRRDYVEKTPGLIADVSTRLHETPDGDQTLKLMRVNRLVPYDESLLENLSQLLAAAAEHQSTEFAGLSTAARP